MKKMKRFYALVLAFVMVLGMSMSAMAANDTSATVTIEGADGTTYNYAQLVKEDRDSTLGWKFVDDTIADAFINAFDTHNADDAIAQLIELKTLEDVNGVVDENKFVEAGDVSSSAALGKALATLKNEATSPITGDSVDLDSFGLYIITASLDGYTYIPMAVYINTAYDDVAAKAKGAKNEITKVLDNEVYESVTEGDVVEYTATTFYPFYSADTDKSDTTEDERVFNATDKVTNATYVEDSVAVYLDKDSDSAIDLLDTTVQNHVDVQLTEDYDYTITFTDGTANDDFTDKFVIDFKYNPEYAGETVVIKYNVTVGAGAEDVNNKIVTNFDTEGSEVTVDKVKVVITKTDDKDSAVKLEGATFAIYEASEDAADGYEFKENVKVVIDTDDPVEQNLYLKDVTSTALYDEEHNTIEAITGTDGTLTFRGLDAGKTYYIKETNAPVGYSLNNNYYQLNTPTENGDVNDQTYTYDDFRGVTVVDTKLLALPSTGGIGTTIFTVGGCVIMIAAVALFLANHRREAR